MEMRVLICRSNPVSPDPRVEKVARSLQKAGYGVSVLGWDRSSELPEEEDRGGVRVHRLRIQADYPRGVMNTLPLLRWQMGLLAWLVRKRGDYDCLHACDFDTILPALFCKWLFRKKLVYDIFDFYADHLRATPGWIKRTIRWVDLWAIGRADAVILVDDARLVQISGAHPRRLAVIYNSPEDASPEPGDINAENGYRLRLAYVGLLQLERGFSGLLDVLEGHPEWRLDLAGFGGDQELILKRARPMPNVTWHGRVPYERAIAINAKSDALIALYDPKIPNHRFASPNKLFEAMMLGKPLIVAAGTSMDRIAEEEGFGLLVKYDDISELETTLMKLARNPQMRLDFGRLARRAYDRTYSWSIMEDKLIALYNQIQG